MQETVEPIEAVPDIIENEAEEVNKDYTDDSNQSKEQVPQEKSTPDEDLVQMTYLQKTTGIIMKPVQTKIRQNRNMNQTQPIMKLLNKVHVIIK